MADANPTRKHGPTNDGAENDLRERDQAFHERIDHTERPGGKKSRKDRVAERIVGNGNGDGNPRDEGRDGFGKGEHSCGQRAGLAAFDMDV